MDSIEVTQLLPFIIPFLTWTDRFALAQANREIRHVLSHGFYALEAFLHINKTYNCHIEVFDMDRHRANPYSNSECNPGLLSIKTWLGAVVRTERKYAKHGAYTSVTIPMCDERWTMIEDPHLEQLVKQVQFLSGGYIKGCQNLLQDEYLRTISRFSYPDQGSFNLDNFMKLIDRDQYLTLASIVHAQYERWPTTMQSVPDPLAQTAVRLVYVSRAGDLTVLRDLAKPDLRNLTNHAMQPFVTRAIMRDKDLMRSYVMNSQASPYAFTRWLTNISKGDGHPLLLSRGDPRISIRDHFDLLFADDGALWEWRAQDDFAVASDKFLKMKQAYSDDAAESHEIISYDVLDSAHVRHWRHAFSRIDSYLSKVFKLFTLDQAQNIILAYTNNNMTLTEVGSPDDCAGAYLEVSLDNCIRGPNPLTQKAVHSAEVCTLYVGPSEAILYLYHERLTSDIDVKKFATACD